VVESMADYTKWFNETAKQEGAKVAPATADVPAADAGTSALAATH